MKVVYVYKGNGKNKKNPVIDAQACSIHDSNIQITKFPLLTSGAFSYFKEYIRLRKFIKLYKPDLVHAHYSYSGIISALACKKTICSLMGSDIFDDYRLIKFAVRFFYKFIWIETIVKSEEQLKIFPNAILIPNGVDLNYFKIIPKDKAIKNTELDKNKINIIFVAEHITSKVKNYQLAKAAMKFLPKNYVLYPITGLKHNELINYYNATDMLLLTSFSEGSPNVIKEAMACNCPIVSTDVGDVKQVIKYTENCYNCNFEPQDVAEKITKVANLQSRSNGRDNIKNLDANLIAKKLCNLYKEYL